MTDFKTWQNHKSTIYKWKNVNIVYTGQLATLLFFVASHPIYTYDLGFKIVL